MLSPSIEIIADDYNFDARQEVRLANDQLFALLAPLGGGHLYELDVRSICLNLLATLTRRSEAYHRKVLAGGDRKAAHQAVVARIEERDGPGAGPRAPSRVSSAATSTSRPLPTRPRPWSTT